MPVGRGSGNAMSTTALTGARAVAAYTVLLAHAIHSTYQATVPGIDGVCARLAYFAMSLFFVLSGFVIHYNYSQVLRDQGFTGGYKFLVARFARLYPLYFLAPIILLALDYLRDPVNTTATLHRIVESGTIFAHLTMAHSWINGQQAIFPPTWSISTEWFFYLAFAYYALFLRRPGSSPQGRYAILWYCLAVFGAFLMIFMLRGPLTQFLITLGPVLSHNSGSSDVWYWFTYYSPFLRIAEFVLGCMASRAYLSGDVPRFFRSNVATVIALGWCAAVIAFGDLVAGTAFADTFPNFVFAPAIVTLMLFMTGDNWLARLLSTRPALHGGDISYSVYLLQGPAFVLAFHFVSPSALGIAVGVVVTTAISTVSYLLIERPARGWVKRLLLLPPRETASAAPTRPRRMTAAAAPLALVIVGLFVVREINARPVAFVYRPPTVDVASIPVAVPDRVLSFADGANRSALLAGWSSPEPWGVWADQKAAYLALALPPTEEDRDLVIDVLVYTVPKALPEQSVVVWINGQRIGKYVLSQRDATIRVRHDKIPVEAGAMMIGFDLSNAASPSDIEKVNDTRLLSIGIKALALVR